MQDLLIGLQSEVSLAFILGNLTKVLRLQKHVCHVDSRFVLELIVFNANCKRLFLSVPPKFFTVWLSSCHSLLTHYGGNALEKRTKVTLH